MIDPALLRKPEGQDRIRKNLELRRDNPERLNNAIRIAARRSELLTESESIQAERNSLSRAAGAAKGRGDDAEFDQLRTQVDALASRLENLKADLENIESDYNNALAWLPNILQEDVPEGKDENDNPVIRNFGSVPDFDFEPRAHYDLAEDLGLVDFARGVKLAGSRFYVYNEQIARLERRLIAAMLDRHARSGYSERMVPFLVNDEAMMGTGQFPKFQDEYYRLERDGLNLIPTAEVPITNLYADEILKEDDLPIRLTAATPCFRREAGSAGRDTRGLIRVHQFQKVELVRFCTPETARTEHEALTADAEAVLQALGLHYRVILLCSGDTGFASARTYDLEVYMPGVKRFVEISSCSDFGDFQARRARIRFRNKTTGKNEFVNTLNGSGVAAGRLIAALLEYCQTTDGIDWQEIDRRICNLEASG